MPRVKNAPKKSSNKKATLKKSKNTSPKREDAPLHQAFLSSLIALEGFWNKKCASLKKQSDTLKAKLEKAASKQKALKAKSSQSAKQSTLSLQEAYNQAKQALAEAKLAANKYVTLGKMIKQFESDWLKKLAEETSPKSKTKTKTKLGASSPITPKKRGRKPKTTLVEEETFALMPAKEDSNETQKPQKARKSKAKEEIQPPSHAESLFAFEEEVLEEVLQEASDDDDLFIPLEDYEAELRIIEEPHHSSDDESFDEY